MNIRTERHSTETIAFVETDEVLVTDVQSALDLMATVRYETDADRLVLQKQALDERFFVLGSRLAGDILQKFANYRMKLAIVGDFSVYKSKALRDFIYECNNGSQIFFVSSDEDAVEKLLG